MGVVTRKGQVTVPAEIRQALGIKQGDKVAFTWDGREARLARAESVVARTAGALRSGIPAGSPRDEKAAFERAVAEDVIEEMRG
ncbi:MAG: AbrB/MazE/SpoVT family DNA-binding domain-containing protein [Chloroflexi bacterium]|nr:AbrB/MazE/SpoVT family DNA-binding domain-containing protein [Chloroflexota bacterium]